MSAEAPALRAARRPLPVVAPERCTGCGRCVAACPPRVLSLQTRDWRKTALLHKPSACTGCSRCAPACPFGALTMQREADRA